MERVEYIDITPHRSIVNKISKTGYSIQEALAELIDNAIDARIEEQKLEVHLTILEDQIEIEDNGTGMSKNVAQAAIRLGFSSKKEKLGEFGLGLKTATSFLGEKFWLSTKEKESNEEYNIEYDEKSWIENGSWTEFPFKVIENSSDKHGTKIIVKDLKITITQKLIEEVKKELEIRFAPFIRKW